MMMSEDELLLAMISMVNGEKLTALSEQGYYVHIFKTESGFNVAKFHSPFLPRFMLFSLASSHFDDPKELIRRHALMAGLRWPEMG